jgi:3-hydroxyanthranilate 3,4-dioxygenase
MVCAMFVFLARLVSKLITYYQILGGPNARTDYHVNETPEWFYQYRGSMLLKVIDLTDELKFKDIEIREGEMFLLPANIPHNPVRFANTAGLVIEQKRPNGSLDRLQWYCENCRVLVKEIAFHCSDLGTQIKDAVLAFNESGEERRCKTCGTLSDVAPPPPPSGM